MLDKAKSAVSECVTKRHVLQLRSTFKKDISIDCFFVPFIRKGAVNLMFMLTDISGLKKAEQEKDKLRKQLQHSQKMEAIGTLAGGIAHDFNNQLTSILVYADLLREEAENNTVLTQYADHIIMGVKRASNLTSQLLAFSRKGKYLNTTVDIHRIVFEVANLLQHSINKKVEIQQELRANPSTVMGDPAQLQNAILNLALNARDAMPNGGKLVFSTDIVDLDRNYCNAQSFEIEPGKFLKLSVIDSGFGIDKKTKERIFEPFFTTKEQGKGTGMGLAAVYGTVKNHRGLIKVTSELGKGSVFVIYLPVSATDSSLKKQKDLKQKLVAGTAHILLVEDEELIRNVTALMLEKLGYTVSVCRNGAEAVDFYRKQWQAINLVILDVIMPEMGGGEAFTIMNKINPDIIVLVSSGYSIDNEAQSIIDKGAKGFIQKPFRTGEISQKISEILKM